VVTEDEDRAGRRRARRGRAPARALLLLALPGLGACARLLGVESVTLDDTGLAGAAGSAPAGGPGPGAGAGGGGGRPGGAGRGGQGAGGVPGAGGDGGGPPLGFARVRFANFLASDATSSSGSSPRFDLCSRAAGDVAWRGPLLAMRNLKPLEYPAATGQIRLPAGFYTWRAVPEGGACGEGPAEGPLHVRDLELKPDDCASLAVVSAEGGGPALRHFAEGRVNTSPATFDVNFAHASSADRNAVTFSPLEITVEYGNRTHETIGPEPYNLDHLVAGAVRLVPETPVSFGSPLNHSLFAVSKSNGPAVLPEYGLVVCESGGPIGPADPTPPCPFVRLLPELIPLRAAEPTTPAEAP
jgi:hypothetical protein